MSIDSDASFNVFHGTEADITDLHGGLSGQEGYENLGLDPFSAFGYTKNEVLDGYVRVSVWRVFPSDIKPKYSLKWASIKREFTPEEKDRHMLTFRRVMEAPKQHIAKKGADVKHVIESESLRQNGLPGEKLSMVIEFTKAQRERLAKEPLLFKAMMLRAVDNNKPHVSIDDLEINFLESCPDIDKMRIYDTNGNLQDSVENGDVILQLFRQSLVTTAHSLQFGDQMSFEAGPLYDLQHAGLLENGVEYYTGRGRGQEIWQGLRRMAKKFEEELLVRYPDLAPVVDG